MPSNKKPRKPYKPKPVRLNALEYAIESVKPLAQHESYVLDWSLKNHAAFEALLQGRATRRDLDILVAARNIVEGIVVTLKGEDPDGTLARSAAALIDICDRANAGKGTAMRAPEIQAIRDLLAAHDDVLRCVTVKEFEVAWEYARREVLQGRAQRLKAIKERQAQ